MLYVARDVNAQAFKIFCQSCVQVKMLDDFYFCENYPLIFYFLPYSPKHNYIAYKV